MFLNPIKEYEHITDWIQSLQGIELTPHKFVRRLGRYLNSRRHPARVKFRYNNEILDPGDFSFGAEYDPDIDCKHGKQFQIDFFINLDKNAKYVIDQKSADHIAIELTEILVHEYEHQKQYRRRRYKEHKKPYIADHRDPNIKQKQEYLGNPDEIEAFAANIAARYVLLGKRSHSLDLQSYYETFGKNHPVTLNLLDKIQTKFEFYEGLKPNAVKML